MPQIKKTAALINNKHQYKKKGCFWQDDISSYESAQKANHTQMNTENIRKGGISVETEHIFPIIKKWLYSEKDIFLREIVSNAQDAITKLKRLSSLGQYDGDDNYKIIVKLNKEEGTLTVEDNGIGLTEEELEKYICQIALSGALDFIKKYEGENDTSKCGIIGHFGLGFYSSFMVSDRVEIETKSYTASPAIHWSCTDSGEYEITEGSKESHGTSVIMHISDEEKDYLDENKITSMLEKYCSFMPIEIYFENQHDEECECEKCKADGDECHAHEAPSPINDTTPLWTKAASDATDEDYKNFYHRVFGDMRDPLFWIHINADYPLNFKGILYFPKFRNEYESIEGQVKLYYNQVFVADNIKEVIPEYLLMLKGVLDCPELPLNVSRSYLQTNTYVSKLSAHIVKKVADKLNSLRKNDRGEYEKVWDDIKAFIEYACMRDRKFYERVKDSLLLKLSGKSYVTVEEYLESAKETNDGVIYYASDISLQAQYISMFESQGIKVALLESNIDTQFASMLEQLQGNLKFVRVDADIASALKNSVEASGSDELKELFIKVSGNEKLNVIFEPLKDSSVPALLNISEESRRLEEMMKLYSLAENGDAPAMPLDITLIINTESSIISKLSSLASSASDEAEIYASYIYKLATLSHKRLSASEMTEFLNDSYKLLEKLGNI